MSTVFNEPQYELNHGLGVPPHHLALWTQLFTVGTVRMVQKATGRVGTVARAVENPGFWQTKFLRSGCVRGGFYVGVLWHHRFCAVFLQRH